MPELPEVQTIVNDLNKKIRGAEIADIWCDWKKMIVAPPICKLEDWDNFVAMLKGKKIENIERAGKLIVFRLSEGVCLTIHLRMTGHFLVIDEKKRQDKGDPIYEKVNQFIHFILYLKDGREAALSDLRKFAKIKLVGESDFLAEVNGAGVDPTGENFTFGVFKNLLKNKKGNIKQILMDQSLVSGIGNIYSSEILWQAKVSPLRKAESLSAEELKNIFCAIGEILRLAIEKRGDSESDYRDTDGKEGGYQTIQKVYQREGKECFRCGAIIKRVKIGQRSGFYCPECQK
ncbi:MAG: bifunctional DNA-formamidopyrimidine glycosylase/DNA-(apurinic or apyrimidinic site) lyase [bacterium]